MAIHADTEQEALRTITLPPGPALLYVSEGDAPTVTILDRIEGGSPPDARDKAICRALLEYVLDQIDGELFEFVDQPFPDGAADA
jgi:hypothetical protein